MAANETKSTTGIEAEIIDADDVDWHEEPPCDCEWWQGINMDVLMSSDVSFHDVHELVCSYGVSAEDINSHLTPYGSFSDFRESVRDLIMFV